MPSATRFPGRIQDMEDYADGQTWAGDHTFNGKIGLGTATVPHSGVGYAKLALEGAGGDGAGPHIQFTTEDDNYPLFQQLNWAHDNVALLFDSYFDGSYRSSYSGGNFRIIKTGDIFRIDYDSGIAPGEVLLWENAFAIDAANGKVGINVVNPSQRLTVNGNILQTTGDYLATDEVRAINGDGLKLYDDGGNGIFVKDGGQVGIGIIDLDGTFHVHTATAGVVSPNLAYNDLVIENDSHAGISILTPSASNAGIVMGRPGADTQGWLLYLHSNDKMQFGAAGSAQMTLSADGLGIGIASSSAKLHVDQDNETAAIPVLYLDQADISEELIEFNTTIGVGNAIEAKGTKSLTTTHFLKVTVPGSLTRYIPCGTIA